MQSCLLYCPPFLINGYNTPLSAVGFRSNLIPNCLKKQSTVIRRNNCCGFVANVGGPFGSHSLVFRGCGKAG